MSDERPIERPKTFERDLRDELAKAARTGRIETPRGAWVLRCGARLGHGSLCLRPRGHEGPCEPAWSGR